MRRGQPGWRGLSGHAVLQGLVNQIAGASQKQHIQWAVRHSIIMLGLPTNAREWGLSVLVTALRGCVSLDGRWTRVLGVCGMEAWIAIGGSNSVREAV